MIQPVTEYGVVSRAIKSGLVTVDCINPRDFTSDKHRTVDDRPYGGGPGMLMKVEPLQKAIAAAKARQPGKVIYLSPQGRQFNQSVACELQSEDHLILLCGRYEGIDERLLEAEVDMEISLGDFVLSGGEIAAQAIIDAVSRRIPGALGHQQSAEQDSFEDGLLDHPHYTRPEVFADKKVPAVLLNGNHAEIERWRLKQRLGRTWQRRPDLLAQKKLSETEVKLLDEFIAEQQDKQD